MADYREYIDRAMSIRGDEQPQPYAVTAGNPGPRGYLPVMQQLQTGMEQRMQNGPRANPNPMQAPPNLQPSLQLRGLFGGINPPRSTGDPRLMRPVRTDDAPSPGLGSGIPNTMMFEDGSQIYPGHRQDELMTLLTELLNRRFPND